MKLIIVESPTKARTLGNFLGPDYEILATMGHIKDLPKSKLSIDVEKNFKPDYLIVETKNKAVKDIKDAAKNSDMILLATDPDREGEAIAQHVSEVVEGKETVRVVFHEITKPAVIEAIENPREINSNLVDAQIARRVLDRLMGYKLSPLLWKKIRRGLSAGRVQTVTVKLIVEREKEIEAFKPEEYWEIFCELKSQTSKKKADPFLVKLIKINGKTVSINNTNQASEAVGDLDKSGYKVIKIARKEVKKYPLAPFTTSTMTQSAARFFLWSAKKTMSVAQGLYEEGLITYHRTDSTNISSIAVKDVRKFIEGKYGSTYLPKDANIYKTKSKSAQEAHEAIRPTDAKKMSDKLELSKSRFKGEAKILYNLIWKRFVASQMNPGIYDENTIEVEAKPKEDDGDKKYLLRTRGQIMKFDGWRILFDKKQKDDEFKLPNLTEGQDIDLVKVISDQKFTKPPVRYNEALLIKTLENLGIGRPSTYAPIITTIQVRNYVEKMDGRFKPTPVGTTVNDFLIKYFPSVFEYSFTADMEDNLDKVAEGDVKWNRVIGDFWKPFEKKLVDVEKKSKRVEIKTEKVGKKCPTCKKGDQVIRIGRFGKFISCSRFPDCDYKDKYLQKIDMKCPGCKKGEVIIKTTRKGKRFYGCSRYPKCEWASWRKPRKKNV